MTDHTPPQRFMLLATARTGSNLLSSLLSAHPAIKMYGELFNLDTLARKDLSDALDDPIAYLRARLSREHRPAIAAVGFKMFYEHLTPDYFQKPIDTADATERLRTKIDEFARYVAAHYDETTLSQRFRAAWACLAQDRQLAVIHLRRRNSLHTLVSLKTAFVTGQFWSLNGDADVTTTIRLSAAECQRFFERTDASAADADRLFAAHRKLDVTYEALVEGRDEQLREIARFLNVPCLPVSTRMRKQIGAPVSQVIANYGELKDWFCQTRWQAFFE
jgi:LPS sulfotransferase NodH